MKLYINKIAKDTIGLTVISLILQGLGILLNVIVSEKLGTASVGVMTLIFSLFGFIMVLANGNIFISTSRFVSEEIGAGHKNVWHIMRYSMTFSLILSLSFTLLSILLAGFISDKLSAAADLAPPLRLIALSLPLASIGSCIKGYFHAVRKVKVPCCGDCIEFAAKWVFLLFSVLFLFDRGVNIYFLIAFSILIGEGVSCVYFVLRYVKEYRVFSKLPCGKPNLETVPKYLKFCLPILFSGYVQMLLSAANDALVPVALLNYNSSAEQALSEYGMFEAMIMPTVFYPAVLLGSLANVLMPEIARAHSADNKERVRSLVHKVLSRSFCYSFFIAGLFFTQGMNIGAIICPSDSLVGETLVKLFPVIPFIYLEIVLESILKGLGKQNFSTVNALCEYAIRILCVIIFVHFYGFSGVLISYYASNIYSNIVRIAVVCKTTAVRFSICDYILKPFIYCASSCLAASAAVDLAKPINTFFTAAIYILSAGISFIIVYEAGKFLSKEKTSAVTAL